MNQKTTAASRNIEDFVLKGLTVLGILGTIILCFFAGMKELLELINILWHYKISSWAYFMAFFTALTFLAQLARKEFKALNTGN